MKYLSILLGLIVVVGTSGCSYWKDATFDPAFQGGYTYGDILVTQKEFLIKKRGDQCDYHMGKSHREIEGYKNGTLHESDKEDIVGLYPKGGRLELTKIWFHYNFDHGWPYLPVAKMLDGPYAGEEVSIEYLSVTLREKERRYKRWYLKKHEILLGGWDTNFIKKVDSVGP